MGSAIVSFVETISGVETAGAFVERTLGTMSGISGLCSVETAIGSEAAGAGGRYVRACSKRSGAGPTSGKYASSAREYKTHINPEMAASHIPAELRIFEYLAPMRPIHWLTRPKRHRFTVTSAEAAAALTKKQRNRNPPGGNFSRNSKSARSKDRHPGFGGQNAAETG